MNGVVLLLVLSGVPAQGASDWSYTGGGMPLPPVANNTFAGSLNQGPGGSFVMAAAALVNPIRGPGPARLLVRLPAGARLTIDGEPTRSPGDTRRFVSPPLQPGRGYVYLLRVEVVRDGKKVADTREVPVRAGEESEVTFTLPAARVAGK
jgi:uncharacterized protein (TIGR03000 family)